MRRVSQVAAELALEKRASSGSKDKTMPPGFWHPGMSGRLNDGAVIEIDGDHQMPLTAPGLLADALHHAAITPG